MKYFQLFLGFLLILNANGDIDWSKKKLYKTVKLTKNGDHSFPMFNDLSRYIYFTAKGGDYGSECEHVYQMDLLNLNINNPKPKFFLFSTGVGQETLRNRNDGFLRHSFVSTFFDAIKKVNDTEGEISKNFFCQKDSLCKAAPEGSELKEVCDTHFFTEHQKGREGLMNFIIYDVYKHFYNYQSIENGWINPKIQNGLGEVYSQSCTDGECVEFWDPEDDQPTEIEKLKGGVFDGFNAMSRQLLIFHGKKGKPKAAGTGVVPLTGSKIFGSTINDMKNNQEPTEFVVSNSDQQKSYIYPHMITSTKTDFVYIATGHDSTANKSNVYLLQVLTEEKEANNQQKVKETKLTGLTDSDKNSNSFHASTDYNNNYIVYVSNRDGSNQLYLSKLKQNAEFPPTFKTKPPTSYDSWSNSIKETFSYTIEYNSDYKWMRLSKSGVLMYTTNKCPQIYQLDTNLKDVNSFHKMSTTLHSYESPDFLNDDRDIVYAANLIRPFDSNNKPKCPTKICDEKNSAYKNDPTLQNYCKGAREKLLPKDNEIFISNKYGNLQRRLTKNQVYDGELKVSPDGQYVVYSTYIDGDYELVRQKVDGSGGVEKLTNKTGFEFDVSFSSPQHNMIVYAASRPSTNSEINLYKTMSSKYDFTNVNKSEIFVYSFDTKTEYQITQLNGRVNSPMFYDDEKIVFLFERGFRQWLHGIKFSVKDQKNLLFEAPVVIEELSSTRNIKKMSKIEGSYNKIVFSSREFLFVSNNFQPVFTNTLVDSTTTSTTTVTVPTQKQSTTKSGNSGNDSNFSHIFKSFNLTLILLFALKLIH